MAYSSSYHFDFEMTTGWGCHPVLIYQIEKIFYSSSTTPKPQINYSNQQYHLLIANKHQKLLTYCLFERLIKDLETDKVKMKPGWDVIRFLFYFEMNRMTYSSGC